MATDKAKVAEQVLMAAAAMFGGLMAVRTFPGMIGPGGIGTGIASRVLEGSAPGTVADYPKPRKFIYDVAEIWIGVDMPIPAKPHAHF